MLLKDKEVAIIGGGPGGLTLAKLLQMQGVHVRVYERDADKYARVQGSPLDLHDESGLAAITRAGLLDVFKSNFMPGADRTTITDPLAQIFFSEHDSPKDRAFGDAHFRPEIDRGVLRKILLDSLVPDTVVWNSHFMSMQRSGTGWLMQFNNGFTTYADLVIAADGANSKLRPYVTDHRPLFSGITMLEGNVYNASKNVPSISSLLKGGKLMAFGKGRDLLMGQKENDEIGFYASFPSEENWHKTNGLDYHDNGSILDWFKKDYPGWSTDWYELFEKANTPFIPRPIYCAPLDQVWEAQPDLTLIGDAAHVMPPFAGEGVNMAMLDALELSDALTRGKFATPREAIADYETAMRKRAAVMAKESLDNGKRMHSDHALETMLHFFRGN